MNVVLDDHDLHFQGHKFDVNISETLRAIENASYDFYTSRYLPSNGTIVNIGLCDLDLNFQGRTFLVMHSL